MYIINYPYFTKEYNDVILLKYHAIDNKIIKISIFIFIHAFNYL